LIHGQDGRNCDRDIVRSPCGKRHNVASGIVDGNFERAVDRFLKNQLYPIVSKLLVNKSDVSKTEGALRQLPDEIS